jgi:Holliday junction resolvase RusA-like endonuclease
MAKKKSYTLCYEERPDFTLNKERTVHHMVRAKVVKEWRQAFCELAQEAMVPSMNQIEVTVQPYVFNARYRQDVGACFPQVKAAIDGLVDAGVLIDDNANIVLKLTFLAPLYGRDALELTISEIS